MTPEFAAITLDAMALLGIDIGTTALKAALFDHQGRQLALARRAYGSRDPGALAWWRTTAAALRALVAGPAVKIDAIGLSGRGGTRIFLDRGGRPLRTPPALAPSPRAFTRAVELAGSRRGGHGLRLIASLIELRDVYPESFARTARAMFAKDYVIWRLTGQTVVDPVSGPDQPDWPPGVRSAPELAAIALSEVRPPWAPAGHVLPAAARETGLREGTTVATGSHDGAAATVGVGAARPGAHSVTLGTNSVYRIVHDDDTREADRFWSPLPGLMVYGADVTLGGYAVDWLISLLRRPRAGLEAAAAGLPAGAGGVVFLPQLGGRVLPRPPNTVAGAFTGLRRSSGPGHLYRAVLEGNAFALRSAREALLETGLPDGDIYLTGGGTVSALWRQILADVFGQRLRRSGVEDGCRGAAIYAGVAADVWPDMAAGIEAMTSSSAEAGPSEQSHLYEEPYRRFLRARSALDDFGDDRPTA